MTDRAVRSPPSLATLLTRLANYGHVVPASAHADTIALVITECKLEMVQCAPAVINGRKQALNFEQYYRALFGMGLDGRKGRGK